MDNKFLHFFNQLDSQLELGMSKDIQAFLKGEEGIKSYDLNINSSKIVIINIILNNFSIVLAKKMFFDFVNFIGYCDINFSIYNEENNKVRYLYYTSTDHYEGTKMEIIIQ